MYRVEAENRNVRIVQAAVSLVFFLFLLNLVYNLIHGDQGWFALKGLEVRVHAAEVEHDNVSQERQALENRVKMLRSGSLDLDLLEERARIVLGYTAPDEKIVLGY